MEFTNETVFAPSCVKTEPKNDCVIVYTEEEAFLLNQTASIIWLYITNRMNYQDILHSVMQLYEGEGTSENGRELVNHTIELLLERNIIDVVNR